MIGKRMEEEMNEQIKYELASAYLYLSMAAYLHSKGLDGMAQWMRAQTQEEMAHAMKFFDHINEREGRVRLLALDEPKREWDSPHAVFRETYEHEQFVTKRINGLMKVAEEESDRAAVGMLQWFVKEQVEEESSTSKVAQKLELIGDSREGLVKLDRELGTRAFAMPPQTGEAAGQ